MYLYVTFGGLDLSMSLIYPLFVYKYIHLSVMCADSDVSLSTFRTIDKSINLVCYVFYPWQSIGSSG